MTTKTTQDSTYRSPLYERYCSPEMTAIFAADHRYRCWRRLWISLAREQRRLGLEISADQIADLEKAADHIDFARVAELERQTRHDVVAHLRHFAELGGRGGGVLHLGATSAFVTDNTDSLLVRDALQLIRLRLATTVEKLADFARRSRDVPTLAYTHFQPAQLTTVGKRTCLWVQDFLLDLHEVEHRLERFLCRGVKGTTGTQASFLTLFDGDHSKVRALDREFAKALGFSGSFPVTGQTYPRKHDAQVLSSLVGISDSCHKMGTDIRLLQGVGEIHEPFDQDQVGSSAMAYKRNPVRSERMCGLARRLLTDGLNGSLNHATQWLERSLDDSSNRRLVIGDAFLCADAILGLAAHIAEGLHFDRRSLAVRVDRELPFMATEALLMRAVNVHGGDRQILHERLRTYSFEAQDAVRDGKSNPLMKMIVNDSDFGLEADEVSALLEPSAFVGRSPEQVDEFLTEYVAPALAGIETLDAPSPRI